MAIRTELRRRVIGQFHRPHGLGGYVAGTVMAHRSSNVERNRWVATRLDLRPTDRVLEIGFGPGVLIEELARRVPKGGVCGIDHSDVMLRRATRRNRAAIQAGRVHLSQGSADDLPKFDQPFDVIVAVNSMLFWRDPPTTLAQLRAALAPAGRIAIATQPRIPTASTDVRPLLAWAGFTDPRIETLPLDPPVVCVFAVSPR